MPSFQHFFLFLPQQQQQQQQPWPFEWLYRAVPAVWRGQLQLVPVVASAVAADAEAVVASVAADAVGSFAVEPVASCAAFPGWPADVVVEARKHC